MSIFKRCATLAAQSLERELLRDDLMSIVRAVYEHGDAPSAVIQQGYEPVVLALDDGRTLTGLLVEERPNCIVIRDVGQDGKQIIIEKSHIDERTIGKRSIMPAGLVNQLGSRQQFLDLVAYLIEIAERGGVRALELKPNPSLYAVPPLPEYEQRITRGFAFMVPQAWMAPRQK